MDTSRPAPISSLETSARLLQEARSIAILTGAGISAESGIPTFRDSLTGLWQRFDPQELATPQAYRRNPALVWGWYEWRRMRVLQSPPNPGHIALAKLAERLPKLTLMTQNVDDLHERAGSPKVLHLHGSLHHPHCFECASPHTLPAHIPTEPENGRAISPPRCTDCGGPIRPGVVWFGESLPPGPWQQAQAVARECDLLISIGTSGLVYPTASLPQMVRERGCSVLLINPNPTEQDGTATHILRGKAGEILPELLNLIPQKRPSISM